MLKKAPTGLVKVSDSRWHDAAIALPYYGETGVFGHPVGYSQQHPTTLRRLDWRGFLNYADHAGANDDRFAIFSKDGLASLGTARSGRLTTVLVFDFIQSGREAHSFTEAHSHIIELTQDGFLDIGYTGGNGYDAFYSYAHGGTMSQNARVGKRGVFVVSTDPVEDKVCVAAVFDGKLITPDMGTFSKQTSYVGHGNNSTAVPYYGLGNFIYTNYRHPSGYVNLFAVGNAFFEQDEVESLAMNPWQMFKQNKRMMFFPSAASAPTLSLPNVTSITANSAVPNVTLTF